MAEKKYDISNLRGNLFAVDHSSSESEEASDVTSQAVLHGTMAE
jgi:hypothetical protein